MTVDDRSVCTSTVLGKDHLLCLCSTGAGYVMFPTGVVVRLCLG